jgi:peptidoglycan DL-endopeptidase LytE
MSESFHDRRLGRHSFQPRQHRVGSTSPRALGWRQFYTPRWRYHLTILVVSLSILPFGLRSGGGLQSVGAAEHPALAWLQGDARRPSVRYHEVAPGESLQSIADRYSLAADTLRWANGLTDLDPIVVGQELLILPTDGVLHFLAPGESARQVAQMYGADPEQVAAFNGVSDPDRPLRGAQLMVPSGKPRPTQAVASLGLASWVSTESSERPEGSKLLQFGDRTVAVTEDADRTQMASQAAAAPAWSWEEIQHEAERATTAALEASKRKAPAPVDYDVQAGDTLIGIAERYGVSPLTVIAANGLLHSDSLSVGQSLVIPPVSGVIYRVQEDDTLSEIAQRFRVDLGPIVDFNALDNAHTLAVGQRLIIPGAEPERPKPPPPPPPPPTPAPAAAPSGMLAGGSNSNSGGYRLANTSSGTSSAGSSTRASGRTESLVPMPATGSGKGADMVAYAMQFLGYRYVFGGTTPAGFDCSGFVYYVHRQSGIALSRGMMGQYTAGPHVPKDGLQPGDIVFFSNTYMPGLSHNGIYIGGGKFIHASDETTGVVITSLSSAYWASRYSGATRVY